MRNNKFLKLGQVIYIKFLSKLEAFAGYFRASSTKPSDCSELSTKFKNKNFPNFLSDVKAIEKDKTTLKVNKNHKTFRLL